MQSFSSFFHPPTQSFSTHAPNPLPKIHREPNPRDHSQGKVFWAKRLGRNNWQFPQGGINKNESIKDAMYRELYEEVGLESKDVQLVYISCRWLKYKIPIRQCQKTSSNSRCIGQKQKWCLLKLLCNEDKINLAVSDHQEFDGWAWVSYWLVLS